MSAASIPCRPPEVVMRLKRLGSFHQCRLSFMRVLMRRMAGEGWTFSRPVFDIDAGGVGRAVYTAKGPERSYSLVAFAHDLPDDQRSDRVIAEAWDATFALFDGTPTPEDLDRLAQNVPGQEAGRISARELTLSRANRSVRLWDHVVDALAKGQQPDEGQIDAVGYLMRTTAVYGSGKFGAADRAMIEDRAEMQVPFQAEMLTVYLIRTFVRDLAEHMARTRGGDMSVPLAPALAERLGIGNSTGLGMAPFVINHPVLFNNWIQAREEALARVRSVQKATPEEVTHFRVVLGRAVAALSYWQSDHPIQIEKLKGLRRDAEIVLRYVSDFDFGVDQPWNRLWQWCEGELSEEGQEFAASLMLEPYAGLVDPLVAEMADAQSNTFAIDGAMPVRDVRALLEQAYGWTCAVDWQSRAAQARAWYVSEEKLEPRLGERHEEPIAPYEQPLAPARDAAEAHQALAEWPDDAPIAEVLLRHPEHRHIVRRMQMGQTAPYAEIRDNTIAADMLPLDMLRAKLSFFGATRFDPRSDRWVRICMFAGAPYPEGLTPGSADLWVYPEVAG